MGAIAVEPDADGAVALADIVGIALALAMLETLADADAFGLGAAASAVGCCATTANALASGNTKASTILP